MSSLAWLVSLSGGGRKEGDPRWSTWWGFFFFFFLRQTFCVFLRHFALHLASHVKCGSNCIQRDRARTKCSFKLSRPHQLHDGWTMHDSFVELCLLFPGRSTWWPNWKSFLWMRTWTTVDSWPTTNLQRRYERPATKARTSRFWFVSHATCASQDYVYFIVSIVW